MTAPRVILFDADGVIQRWSPRLRPCLAELIPDRNRVDQFISELAAAEEPCLSGLVDPAASLAAVLSRWGSPFDIEDLWECLTLIEPDAGILSVIESVRIHGVQCHLATNQQCHRARFMSEQLGYAELFDSEFYSCDLGVVKPDPAYFAAIIEELGEESGSMLFVDDREGNVEGARACGLLAFRFEVAWGASTLRALLNRYGLGTGD